MTQVDWYAHLLVETVSTCATPMGPQDYETTETLIVEPHLWTQFAETLVPDTMQWRCGRCKFHYRMDHPWCLSCGMRLIEPEPIIKSLPYLEPEQSDDPPTLIEWVSAAIMLVGFVILGILILIGIVTFLF